MWHVTSGLYVCGISTTITYMLSKPKQPIHPAKIRHVTYTLCRCQRVGEYSLWSVKVGIYPRAGRRVYFPSTVLGLHDQVCLLHSSPPRESRLLIEQQKLVSHINQHKSLGARRIYPSISKRSSPEALAELPHNVAGSSGDGLCFFSFFPD